MSATFPVGGIVPQPAKWSAEHRENVVRMLDATRASAAYRVKLLALFDREAVRAQGFGEISHREAIAPSARKSAAVFENGEAADVIFSTGHGDETFDHLFGCRELLSKDFNLGHLNFSLREPATEARVAGRAQ